MRLNGKKYILGLLAAVIMVAVPACTDDDYVQPGSPQVSGNEEIMVKIAIRLPGPTTPATRALSETDEYHVEEIDVLMFEANGGPLEYVGQCAAPDIKPDAVNHKKKTFEVELKEGTYDLVIIANARGILKEAASEIAGLDKADALAVLSAAMPAGGKWLTDTSDETNYSHIPMWGDVGTDVEIKEGTDLTGTTISLLRMVAKVSVTVNKEDGEGKAIDFILTSIHVYNYNSNGRVVPGGAWDSNNDLVADIPTLPTDPGTLKGPIEYRYDDAGGTKKGFDGNKCEGEIYLFEADNHTLDADSKRVEKAYADRTCLVIGGRYGGENEAPTYYRVDFLDDSDDLLDILRNHQYAITITSVTGEGYEEPGIAVEKHPVNMEAIVLRWSDGGMGNIAFDGQHTLSVSQDEFLFGLDEKTGEEEDNVLYVLTDYTATASAIASGDKSGWYVEKIVDAADEKTVVTWLSISPETPVAGKENERTKVIIKVKENDTNPLKERKAIIWFAAGRLRYPVYVTQSIYPALGLHVVDGNDDPVTELVFTSSILATTSDTDITQQALTVNWKPATAYLTVTNTQIGDYAFPSDVGTPSAGKLTGVGGTKAYNIEPTVFTKDQLQTELSNYNYPFLEKVSKVDFTTTNGFSYATASVFLRQIYYNLVTDVKNSYTLESQESFTVRANFDWKIISITGDVDILQNRNDLLNETGGSTTTGNKIPLTMADDPLDGSLSGKTATITFTSLVDDSEWDVDITAVGIMLVGRFAGKLVRNGNEWKFERMLYVQGSNASEGEVAYSQTPTNLDDLVESIDGRENTYTLYTANPDHSAAALCYEKNTGPITGASDLTWYLPSKNQLMAIWTVHNSFGTAGQFTDTDYWSSNQFSKNDAWFVDFSGGAVNRTTKSVTKWVRCVRER